MEKPVAIFDNQPLSTISDPFKLECVQSFFIHGMVSSYTGKWNITGKVKFVNKNTKGEQEFAGETVEDVVLKMRSFFDELNKDL